jgi:hypothetical protein
VRGPLAQGLSLHVEGRSDGDARKSFGLANISGTARFQQISLRERRDVRGVGPYADETLPGMPCDTITLSYQ